MTDTAACRLERDNQDIAWLTLDVPGSSANTLGRAVLLELEQLLGALSRQVPRGLVIRSGKPSGFIAGADIREFVGFKSRDQALEQVRLGQRVCAAVAALPCPTVAALHGFAMGGGLELALACRYRIGLDDGRLSLGLPEVMLGIHPGFGGSVRSVRLLGVRAAMELMLSGKPVRADKARGIGLVDKLVSTLSELETAARDVVLNPPAPRRAAFLERALSWPGVRLLVKPALEKQVRAKAPRQHFPAPYALIDLWARHGARCDRAFEAEARSIAELFETPTAHGLVRVFLLQERLKSLAKSGSEVSHVHVIGAGVMGGDIAAWCALRGLNVTLQDRELKYIEPALQRAAKLYEKRIAKPDERAAAMARLQADVAGDGVAQADVVIEAIFEDLAAKRALYAAAEPKMRAGTSLASNTSSLPIESLAQQLRDPTRMLGLHFFNPVPQMPLVEVIHGAQTGDAHIQRAMGFARRIDKLPLPCRSGPGFLVNRVLFPYLHEALFAAGEGIPLATIDRAAVEFGMPMGPIELADVVGLDVLLHVGEIFTSQLNREAPPHLAKVRELVAAKKLGRKSGAGFYVWQDGKAVRDASAAAPAPPELALRLLLPLINECVACLREGIVADLDLVDAGVIFGTGFAPFRGGPLFYARTEGVQRMVETLREFQGRYGARFAPDAGWSQIG